MFEYRVAIGTPTSRRSTIWKFISQNNSVYIISRMFGSDTKVSLHPTGECQWSRTDGWVKKVPGRKNSDRHIKKWKIPQPNSSDALLVFRIHIPETELREIKVAEDIENVEWLDIPALGSAVSLECYITPASEFDPSLTNNLPCPRLISLRLSDGRWFVILYNVTTPNRNELEDARIAILEQASTMGYLPQPEHRIVAFTEMSGYTRGFIELCSCTG